MQVILSVLPCGCDVALLQARAPTSLKKLDGKEIEIPWYSWKLFVELAFDQQDGDKY